MVNCRHSFHQLLIADPIIIVYGSCFKTNRSHVPVPHTQDAPFDALMIAIYRNTFHQHVVWVLSEGTSFSSRHIVA